MDYSFFAGFVPMMTAVPLIENLVHEYVLHNPKSVNPLIKAATKAHHYNHHGAYRSPEHYYRDATNEKVVMHFSPKDVAFIAASGSAVGGAISLLPGVGPAAIVGSLTAIMIGYVAYESSHNFMHVNSARRLEIGRVMGDYLEDGERSGNLRFPKPTLDYFCNVVESQMKGKFENFTLYDNFAERLKAQGIKKDVGTIFDYTTQEMVKREKSYLQSASLKEKTVYNFESFMHRLMRRIPALESIDNNHFLHHQFWLKNLNVAFTIGDSLLGTKEDSSISRLLAEKKLWLCPNSPDAEPFVCK